MDWNIITQKVSAFITAAAPIAEAGVAAVAPEAAAALAIGEKIIQGALAAEPSAVALVDQIAGGTPPTPEQLKAFEADYEDAYQKTRADIATKLAALPV